MLGFRMAYDYYLRSRVKDKRQASKFRLKRSKLVKLIQPDLEIRQRMVEEFEYEQTQALLQKSLASSLDRGTFWIHLERRMSEHNTGYAERREVCI